MAPVFAVRFASQFSSAKMRQSRHNRLVKAYEPGRGIRRKSPPQLRRIGHRQQAACGHERHEKAPAAVSEPRGEARRRSNRATSHKSFPTITYRAFPVATKTASLNVANAAGTSARHTSESIVRTSGPYPISGDTRTSTATHHDGQPDAQWCRGAKVQRPRRRIPGDLSRDEDAESGDRKRQQKIEIGSRQGITTELREAKNAGREEQEDERERHRERSPDEQRGSVLRHVRGPIDRTSHVRAAARCLDAAHRRDESGNDPQKLHRRSAIEDVHRHVHHLTGERSREPKGQRRQERSRFAASEPSLGEA